MYSQYYIKDINESYKAYKNGILDSDTEDDKSIYLKTEAFSSYLIETIKKFFVDHGNDVKKIYKSIRENEFPYNKVECVDIDTSEFMYDEYVSGLSEFMNILISIEDDDGSNPDTINQTLTNTLKKDTMYIDSIFGGDNNKMYEMSLSDAVKQIECLIDFVENAKKYASMCTEINNRVKSSKNSLSDFNSLKQYGEAIFYNSISYYGVKLITSVLTTFHNIMNSIEKRVPADGFKTPPKYQLF